MKENSFFYSDLKVLLVVAVPASWERFTFCLLGLSDLDYSTIFIFWIFFKRFAMSKTVVSKNKANYKLMLLIHNEKKYKKIIKINMTKVFI